ncbi:MAG: HEAT repeat domain-containing protein [Thermogemmatispora sp.]|uniref:M1 family aminopeptidase n=3 Tax=Thermogemmatispora sp. TaxID=1968838 RepID=UPI001D42BB95|nr:M1 family aminopeptidase [Thermogemmatispora sp.]MBX5450753.1 HEAT repeat domain-containing protein [Thermogemmatispora sp.]
MRSYFDSTYTAEGCEGWSLREERGGGLQALVAPPPKARAFELPGDSVHYAPDRPADITHVKLEISLDFERETVRGTAWTSFTALYDEVRTVAFDAVDLHIEQVMLDDGASLSYSLEPERLIVTLDRPYRYGEAFTIGVRYWAQPRIGLNFNKPTPDDPTRPVQAWTFSQTWYHRHWFPCHWAPNDRATSEIIVTVPAQFVTLSNGQLLSVRDNGDGTKTHHWRHDVPHPAYLISLVVGDFAIIEDHYGELPVTYYVRPERRDEARLLMGKTPAMIEFFSRYLDYPYPYSKYAQSVVEVYRGAMEHTTATTHSFMLLFDQKAALDVGEDGPVTTVAHELAHQWFGDLLTCRDWSEGWLNEGFATYLEHLWIEHDRGSDVFKFMMREEARLYFEEDKHYRRPVVYRGYYRDGFELFDRHLYSKGAWVLHMLRHQLGEAAFRRGLHAYLERHRGREVITADLERTLEEVTGRSLARFFQQWLYQAGYPAFSVSYAWDSQRHLARLTIKQTQTIDDLTPCFVTPIDLSFSVPVADGSSETRVVNLQVVVGENGETTQTFFVPLEREPVMVRFDPDGWLLKTLEFERPATMLRYQLAHDPDVLGRIEAAEALARHGDEASRQALAEALFADPFWGVRCAAAKALGDLGTEDAQEILLRALHQLEAREWSRVRATVARALGRYQVPQQSALAQRSAEALIPLVNDGDVSYAVEHAAAEALGRTRVAGVLEVLQRAIARPSWQACVQQGIFRGLACCGDERAIPLILDYLDASHQPPLWRLAATSGLQELARERHLYRETSWQQAVTRLCEAVEHDPWEAVRQGAALALQLFGERRAIPALERAAARELETRALRSMRVALHVLRSAGQADEQLAQLRQDVETLREENRRLKEHLAALETHLAREQAR